MTVVSLRNAVASWLRRVRAACENLADDWQRSESGLKSSQLDPLAGVRCVWYGRAMFCLYLPDPNAPAKSCVDTMRDVDQHRDSDPHTSSNLHHAVAWEFEELDRTSRISAHRGE